MGIVKNRRLNFLIQKPVTETSKAIKDKQNYKKLKI